MAKFRQIGFHIDRNSYSAGSVCTINYDYFVAFDQQELSNKTRFSVYCELWGANLLNEKQLSEIRYDSHEFEATHAINFSRNFVVPCDLLNEKLGEDYLFIKLKLYNNYSLVDEIKSEEVHDSF